MISYAGCYLARFHWDRTTWWAYVCRRHQVQSMPTSAQWPAVVQLARHVRAEHGEE